jgi:hypothetical protein
MGAASEWQENVPQGVGLASARNPDNDFGLSPPSASPVRFAHGEYGDPQPAPLDLPNQSANDLTAFVAESERQRDWLPGVPSTATERIEGSDDGRPVLGWKFRQTIYLQRASSPFISRPT